MHESSADSLNKLSSPSAGSSLAFLFGGAPKLEFQKHQPLVEGRTRKSRLLLKSSQSFSLRGQLQVETHETRTV